MKAQACLKNLPAIDAKENSITMVLILDKEDQHYITINAAVFLNPSTLNWYWYWKLFWLFEVSLD